MMNTIAASAVANLPPDEENKPQEITAPLLIAGAIAPGLAPEQRVSTFKEARAIMLELERSGIAIEPRFLDRIAMHGEGMTELTQAFSTSREPAGRALWSAINAASPEVGDFIREVALFSRLRRANEGGVALDNDTMLMALRVATQPKRLLEAPMAQQLACLAHQNVTPDQVDNLRPFLTCLARNHNNAEVPALMARRLLTVTRANNADGLPSFMEKLDIVLSSGWPLDAWQRQETKLTEMVEQARSRLPGLDEDYPLLTSMKMALAEREAANNPDKQASMRP